MSLTRFARTFTTSTRIMADNQKGMLEKAGDTLKQAAQAFKSDGSVGKEFNADGAVGGTAQQVGGPFDKDGAIGKQFKDSGAVGGAVEKGATDAKQQGEKLKDQQ